MPFSSFSARISLGLCVFVLLACSHHKKLTQEQSCAERFKKTQVKFEKKKWSQAKEELPDLISSCTGSPFLEQASFELAESYFRLGDWIEAQSDLTNFLKDYPGSRQYGEQAQYWLGVAVAKQVYIVQRDQSKTLEAVEEFETFLTDYPDSKYTDSAKTQLDKLKDKLAQKDFLIAKLYQKMDEPQAAAIYYKEILKEYGGRVNLRELNLKLAECYITLKQFDEAEAYLVKFDGIAKEDPFLEKVKRANRDLEKARAKLARQKKEEQQEQGKRQEPM
jgi:outer membrane protein assembly factor BamD